MNLLEFNLEPLTDTLEELSLRGNGFLSLPKQLQNRKFPRLRKLDISHNPLIGTFLSLSIAKELANCLLEQKKNRGGKRELLFRLGFFPNPSTALSRKLSLTVSLKTNFRASVCLDCFLIP